MEKEGEKQKSQNLHHEEKQESQTWYTGVMLSSSLIFQQGPSDLCESL